MADFLIPPRQQRLLSALLLHPERTYSYNDLIRIGGSGRGANQRVLRDLLASGVVLDERLGNQRRIRANRDFPLFAELRSICVKSFGIVERLRETLQPLVGDIDFAFVFGSVALGKDRSDSDIDLFVVGPVRLLDLSDALAGVEEEIGRKIHVVLYDREEWEAKRSDRIVARIVDGPKLMVIGDGPPAGKH